MIPDNTTEEVDAQDLYNQFKEKYDLPDFSLISQSLEISCFDDSEHVLSTIKKKIQDKVNKYIDILDSVVQPDTSTASMYENRFITDQERQKSFECFKKLMIISKDCELASLLEEDEKNAAAIKAFFNDLPEINSWMNTLITKLKESWEQNSDAHEEVFQYFG